MVLKFRGISACIGFFLKVLRDEVETNPGSIVYFTVCNRMSFVFRFSWRKVQFSYIALKERVRAVK